MLAKLYQPRLPQNSMAYNEDAVKLNLPVSERDHIQGPNTEPVTLVEYGDYECPYCAQAYLIIKKVQERLGNKPALSGISLFSMIEGHCSYE
jgi:protein-disulfide isomerase